MINTLDTQQGDVDLFQINDDGEISVIDGIVAMSGGLETSVFLSLFGGNEDDQGRENDSQSWWGNLLETSSSSRYRSKTQHLLQSLPLTSSNLLRVEDAAKQDLQYLITEDIASSVTVVASIPAVNRLCLEINVDAEGEESTFRFVANWLNQPTPRG